MAETVHWAPASVPVARDPAAAGDLSYLLVEEVVRGRAHLQRWPWPGVDREGRLTWVAARPLGEVLVPAELLRWQLYQPQEDGLRRRPRAGDVFAVRWAPGRPATSGVTDLRRLFTEAYDVSADAREAAKLAHLAVQTGQLDPPPDDAAPGDLTGAAAAAPAAVPRPLALRPPPDEP